MWFTIDGKVPFPPNTCVLCHPPIIFLSNKAVIFQLLFSIIIFHKSLWIPKCSYTARENRDWNFTWIISWKLSEMNSLMLIFCDSTHSAFSRSSETVHAYSGPHKILKWHRCIKSYVSSFTLKIVWLNVCLDLISNHRISYWITSHLI